VAMFLLDGGFDQQGRSQAQNKNNLRPRLRGLADYL
jgi:hypothetical protein